MLGPPFAAALMFFSQPIPLVWTRSPAVAAQASSTLAALALAMLLNSCMQVPYALQLALGQTRVSLWINGVGVLVMVPLLVGLVQAFGIFGGGLAWAAFNTAYFVAAPLLLHRRAPRGHLLRWLVRHTLPFLVLAPRASGAPRGSARRSRPPPWRCWPLRPRCTRLRPRWHGRYGRLPFAAPGRSCRTTPRGYSRRAERGRRTRCAARAGRLPNRTLWEAPPA